jgi:uncharacterized protein YjbI with pentapeptide repeats
MIRTQRLFRSRRFIAAAMVPAILGSLLVLVSASSASAVVSCPTVAVSFPHVATPAPADGLDWSGCDLSFAWFGATSLSNMNLAGANLTGTSFNELSLTGFNFAGANLTGASLSMTSVSGANLTGANLTGANLTNAAFPLANLTNSNLIGATLTGANLSTATLTGVRATGVITTTAPSLPARWSVKTNTASTKYLVGPGADFTNADLTGMSFATSDLTGANFTGATLTSANLSGATLTGVKSGGIVASPAPRLPASWSLLANSTPSNYLVGPGANLANANLTGMNLTGVVLTGANLSAATLTDANLTAATLTDANLTAATLTGANLTAATLTNVLWSNTTCPDGTNSSQYVSACSGLFLARTPTFDTPVRTATGFTVNVTNFDAAFAFAPTVSVGSGTAATGTASGSMLPLNVTGVSAGSSATLSVSVTRTGYAPGSANISGVASETATVTAAMSSETVLANTGSNPVGTSAIALLILSAGALLVTARRRFHRGAGTI